MITVETIADVMESMGMNPIIDKDSNSVSVVYEMATMVCEYDDERRTISIYGINRSGLSKDSLMEESRRCHKLNEKTNIGKCFIDDDGDQMIAYQTKLLREKDLPAILQDGLGCLAAMQAMYIRMSIDFSKIL